MAREGYLVLRGGRVVGFRARRPKGSRLLECEPAVLIPGLVDAHAHLRFSAGALKRSRGGFTEWIRGVLAAPPPDPNEMVERLRVLVARGTTCVADHDMDGLGARALAKVGIAGVAFREIFAFDPATGAAAARTAAAAARRAARPPVVAGLAPHAPYTVVGEALAAAARSRLRLSIHLAESRDEIDWLRDGSGALERLLWDRGRRPAFPIPRSSPTALLERAGCLRRGTLIVHANEVARRDLGRLARSGCVAVHCPGTHRYFRRGDPPVRRWLGAGLPFALGTDSLASNAELDLFREMALLHRADRSVAPAAIFEAATTGAARALGLPRRGSLLPGSIADIVAVRVDVKPSRPERFFRLDLFEALVERPQVVEVRLGSS